MQLVLVFILRATVLAFAIWGSCSRNPRFHVPAILVLLIDLGALWLALSIVWDPRAYAMGSPGLLIWVMSGPLLLAGLLPNAMTVAAVPTFASLVAALAVGYLVWRRLWRRSRKRVWTIVAALCGAVSALVALEISVEAVMRIDAMRIPNNYDFQRTSALDMAIKGSSQFAATRHGRLENDIASYTWSFRKGGWVRSPDCKPDDTVGCYAQDWR